MTCELLIISNAERLRQHLVERIANSSTVDDII